MGRDSTKIETIAVNALEYEINRHDVLRPEIERNDKTPFFDGYIWVYEDPKQKNDNYLDRIPIQVKGAEVNSFSKDKCHFSKIKKSSLDAYKKDSGILFFVVEILKKRDKNVETKIFWKQLLPYDIDSIVTKMKKNTTTIELYCLENNDLTLICQNFIQDKQKQKHGNIKPIYTINGIKEIHLSAITGEFFGKGDKGLNNYILAKNPLYIYVIDQNDSYFPVGNIQEGTLLSQLQADVLVGNKPFGNHYFRQITDENGCYFQFGNSTRFMSDGQLKFSATGTLDERIKDINFILEVINGGKIRIGDAVPFILKDNHKYKEIREEMIQVLNNLDAIRKVFNFLGIHSPIDITSFTETDIRRIAAIAEYVIHGKEKFIMFKNDGLNTLQISKYVILLLTYQGKILNYFSNEFVSTVQLFDESDRNRRIEISPYFKLGWEAIAKSSNFNAEVIMESIRIFPYSNNAGLYYSNLLLETIKAIDFDCKNEQVTKLAIDLSNYLIEADDIIIQLNKLQIKKRLGSFDVSDVDWLKNEKTKQDDPKILCGIAILLSEKNLFDEQFAKLSEQDKSDFQKYPIMKLLDNTNE